MSYPAPAPSPALPLPTNTKVATNEKSREVVPITISKDAVKRLLKDIQQIIKNPPNNPYL